VTGLSRGFGLYEALVSLTLLAVGLLALGGLVRSVAQEMEQARAAGESALVAQQALEEALADTAATATPLVDTVWVGTRGYVALRSIQLVRPQLERIRVVVTVTGAPGFGRRPSRSVYSTYRRPALPRPLSP
jgi:Tfp pilus assembly protein PilV